MDGPNETAVAERAREQDVRAQGNSSDDVPSAEDSRAPRCLGSRPLIATSLPIIDVPDRRSSGCVRGHDPTSRRSSVQKFPPWRLPTPSNADQVIPSRDRSDSPVRKALQRDAVSSKRLRRSPSKTFIRPAPPLHFLDRGTSRYDRIDMSVQLPASLFVDGGTIEGHINICVDSGPLQKSKANPIFISKLTTDVEQPAFDGCMTRRKLSRVYQTHSWRLTEFHHSGARVQRVELAAGPHKQTWVNGAMIFVNIHIANKSSETIKKVETQLVKKTLWYSHLAVGIGGKIANYLRLPKRTDKELVSTSTIKKSKDWRGIFPNCSDVRTYDISVPRGLVTISTGRFFEVRYFLNVIVTVSMFKIVTVQLPVMTIHMNTLDMLLNSLVQVAASIEVKRGRTVSLGWDDPLYPPFHPGQAFTAPRRQSLDRKRDDGGGFSTEELNTPTRDLDDPPRRDDCGIGQGHDCKVTLSTAISDDKVLSGRPSGVSSSPSPSHAPP